MGGQIIFFKKENANGCHSCTEEFIVIFALWSAAIIALLKPLQTMSHLEGGDVASSVSPGEGAVIRGGHDANRADGPVNREEADAYQSEAAVIRQEARVPQVGGKEDGVISDDEGPIQVGKAVIRAKLTEGRETGMVVHETGEITDETEEITDETEKITDKTEKIAEKTDKIAEKTDEIPDETDVIISETGKIKDETNVAKDDVNVFRAQTGFDTKVVEDEVRLIEDRTGAIRDAARVVTRESGTVVGDPKVILKETVQVSSGFTWTRAKLRITRSHILLEEKVLNVCFGSSLVETKIDLQKVYGWRRPGHSNGEAGEEETVRAADPVLLSVGVAEIVWEFNRN